MRQQWLDYAIDLASQKESFYSGCRKIFRGEQFTIHSPGNDLAITDIGYTKSKLTILTRGYVHEESRGVAVKLWEGRLLKRKYGSVGFHCFGHLVKGGTLETVRSKRASIMGPCIQSVSITLGSNGKTKVDLFYRTTELFKKFPADLIFIQQHLLSPFDFSTAPIESWTFHFANVTCHPMYFVTLVPLLKDPIKELEALRKADLYFYNWTVKWTARFTCPEYHRGIAKFAQALRVKMAAEALIPPDVMSHLQDYLRKNHPGHQGNYSDDKHSGD